VEGEFRKEMIRRKEQKKKEEGINFLQNRVKHILRGFLLYAL